MSKFNSVVGPKPKPLIGNVAEFGRDPLAFITHCSEKYGEIVRLRLETERDTYLISHPQHVEHILVNTNRSFSKGYLRNPVMKLVLGNGLVTSEGDFWLRQRRLMQPAFHRQQVSVYADIVVNFTRRLVTEWQTGMVRDIQGDMMQLTMEIVSKTIFDVDLHNDLDAAKVGQALSTVLETYNAQMTSLVRHILGILPLKLPVPGDKKLNEAVKQLDKLIYKIIAQREDSSYHQQGDLLSMLLAIRDEDGSQMSKQQLRDEVVNLFLAGHETTANTLSWTWYLLAQHPEVEAKLYREIEQVLGNRPPAYEDVARLGYTQQIIKEAMRLYPPVWWISRETLVDWQVGGINIPVGSEVAMSQWVMHRSPQYYPQPLVFLPERWTTQFEKELPKYAYFPFGGGPRLCIGNNFAWQEAILVLVTIAQNFRLRLQMPAPIIEPEPSITLRPKSRLVMGIEKVKN